MGYCHWTYPLTNMAMEKCPFVDNCPIKTPSTENFQLPCLITLWGNGNINTGWWYTYPSEKY